MRAIRGSQTNYKNARARRGSRIEISKKKKRKKEEGNRKKR